MQSPPESFYAQRRVQSGFLAVLRDDDDSPPEALLQSIWQHQRLRRADLTTLEGVPVRVLHPGFRSWEGGPDFRNAMVMVGEELRTGDIEVDLRASGWHAHGHDRNPHFQNVILHVIWEGDRPAPGGPTTLELKPRLDAPLGELSLWIGGQPQRDLPELLRGRCCRAFKGVAAPSLIRFLHEASTVRLQSKAAWFQARAKLAGYDQALWEGLFRGLGYKQNVWPMQRLAELRTQCLGTGESPAVIEARLFGLSGLLPSELPRNASAAGQHVRQLWDNWWRERDALSEYILPRTIWRLNAIRPANHPHRRLALAAHWLADRQLPGKIVRWCYQDLPPKELRRSLLTLLRPPPDEFWERRFTLFSRSTQRLLPLLGEARITDLAINVILPWAWAQLAEKPVAGRRIQERYFAWPAAQDNAILKLARQRLLGGATVQTLSSAAAQQGLMQIVRDFCDHTNALCDGCKLPGIMADWLRVNPGHQPLASLPVPPS